MAISSANKRTNNIPIRKIQKVSARLDLIKSFDIIRLIFIKNYQMKTIFLVYIKGKKPRQFDDVELAYQYKEAHEVADQMINAYEPTDYKLSVINLID